MKTILVKAYVANNVGDDLFLKILFERYPKTHFLLLGNKKNTKFLKRYSNIKVIIPPDYMLFNRIVLKILDFESTKNLANKFRDYLWRIFFKSISVKIDGYVIIGGSMFIESNENEISLNDKTNLYATELIKKPKYIIGANFGPYKSNNYLNLYKEIFKKFNDICFREEFSSKLFINSIKTRYCADIVFQLKIPKIEKLPKSIGFSLIDLSRRDNLKKYENEYLKFIDHLIHHYDNLGYCIYLFSFCEVEGDEIAINRIMNILPIEIRKKVNIVLYKSNIDIFIKTFGKMEIIISTRFHAMILGILFKQKIFPIIYSEKMSNVLSDIEYKGTSIEINNLNVSKIDLITKEIHNNRILVESLHKSAHNHFIELDKFLPQ